MTVSFAPDFSAPWFTGEPSSDLVPSVWPIAIGGHPYLVEPALYQRATIPRQRDSVDNSAEPGEQSLSNDGTWRRHVYRWDHGAGQDHWEGVGADRYRFRSSKGINVFDEERHFTLLNDTRNVRSHTAAEQILLSAGGYLYASRDSVIEFTADPTGASPTWTANTGGGGPYTSLASDGRYLFACDGANVYRIALGTSGALPAAWSTDDFTFIAFVNGFLIGAIANILYSIDSSATKTALHTGFFNANAVVKAAVATPSGIFVGVNYGDKGYFFFIQLNASTGALTVPTPAGDLPDGETINAMEFYGGKILIGTSIGFRIAEVQDRGLAPGPAIEVTNGVNCLEPQGQFCWFGWKNYDTTSTGLGRADLEETPQFPLVPAYASDLMATSQGVVRSVVSFRKANTTTTLRYFSINGVGIFAEYSSAVSTGTILGGELDVGTPDDKVAVSLEERHDPLAGGSIAVALITDDGTSTDIISDSVVNSQSSGVTDTPNLSTESFELSVTLTRDSVDPTLRPHIKRLSFTGVVTPRRVDQWSLPIHLNQEVDVFGTPATVQVLEEYLYLKSLELGGFPVIYQEGTESYSVIVDQVSIPEDENRQWIRGGDQNMTFMEGLCMVRLIGVTPIG